MTYYHGLVAGIFFGLVTAGVWRMVYRELRARWGKRKNAGLKDEAFVVKTIHLFMHEHCCRMRDSSASESTSSSVWNREAEQYAIALRYIGVEI